jgi:CelD/BcsL family acetyltransferase involved in cellulose biosynthesis
VQLLRIAVGGRAIGYLYNFRHRGRIYAYQSGFDDSDRAMRPGYVCHALAVVLNAEQGAEEYDFLAGDNRLKRTFGHNRYVMSWCSLRRRKFSFRAEMAVYSMIRRIAGRACS